MTWLKIYFYDEHDSIIQGNIIKCTNSIFDKSNNAANIADGDQLTNFSAKEKIGSVLIFAGQYKYIQNFVYSSL